jgi:Kef-type K+ transport system membrane component KefB
MVEVLTYLSLIIVVSAILTIIARIIKQPPIIAYLISGILVGPLVLNWIGPNSASEGMLQTFAHVGVALLLFIVGMSLDFRLLKEIGKISLIAGSIEIIAVGIIGFLVAICLGFSNIVSFYIGAAIAFSSTVVVVKLLSDKKELDTLHGKIALGILIVQDIAASILLMILPLLKYGGEISIIFKELAIAIILITAVFVLSGLLFNKFLTYLAKSQETLFIFAIAWALIISALFNKLGLSIEIGALVAGMSLASTKYTLDLESKIKPLRDFFVVLFFVFFGSQLSAPISAKLIIDALILSAIVMIIKPLVVMISLKFLGYTKRINLFASLSLAQVSEFSLILVLLGFNLGQVNKEIMNLAILVALFTIGLSTYAINSWHYIAEKLGGLLFLFDGKIKAEEKTKKKGYEVILFGYHRMGYKLLEQIKKIGLSFVIVDYNPKVVSSLNSQKINAIYGDAANRNFLEEIDLDKAKLVISTVPEEVANMNIKEALNSKKSKATFIATAEQPRVAIDLYEAGADYVLIPHHLGGEYASFILEHFKDKKEEYKKMGKEHFKSLKSAKKSSTFE